MVEEREEDQDMDGWSEESVEGQKVDSGGSKGVCKSERRMESNCERMTE